MRWRIAGDSCFLSLHIPEVRDRKKQPADRADNRRKESAKISDISGSSNSPQITQISAEYNQGESAGNNFPCTSVKSVREKMSDIHGRKKQFFLDYQIILKLYHKNHSVDL